MCLFLLKMSSDIHLAFNPFVSKRLYHANIKLCVTL